MPGAPIVATKSALPSCQQFHQTMSLQVCFAPFSTLAVLAPIQPSHPPGAVRLLAPFHANHLIRVFDHAEREECALYVLVEDMPCPFCLVWNALRAHFVEPPECCHLVVQAYIVLASSEWMLRLFVHKDRGTQKAL